MAHVLSKTLRNVASHEKITMPRIPTPNRTDFNQMSSLHSALWPMFISVSNQKITKRNYTQQSGGNICLVSEPLIPLYGFIFTLISQAEICPHTPSPKNLLRKHKTWCPSSLLPKITNCSLLQPQELCQLSDPNHRATEEPDMLTKYYLLSWFLVHSTGTFSSQSPKAANSYPNPQLHHSPGHQSYSQTPKVAPASHSNCWLCFLFSNIMKVLLFQTYFSWKDLYVLMTSLSDFTLCPLKSQPQLVK